MTRSDDKRVDDIVATAAEISDIVNRGRESFDNDLVLRRALERCLEILGEAAKALTDQAREAIPEVPWSQVVRLRDRLSHHYHRIDTAQLWVTVRPTCRGWCPRSRRGGRGRAARNTTPTPPIAAHCRVTSPHDHARNRRGPGEPLGRGPQCGPPRPSNGQIRYEMDVDGRTITLLECRPPWRPEHGPGWSRFPIARLRYTKTQGEWAIYWRDRNRKFHLYELVAPTSNVDSLLAEISADPTGIFFG